MATVQESSAAGAAARGPLARVPFPVVDEVARHCMDSSEPNTVHIEIHLPGRLSPDRLREAFAHALRRHPRALMRERTHGPFARRYEWELTDGPDTEVVSVPQPVPGALTLARARALTAAPPLSASPPLRLEVVEEPGTPGCVLLFTVHHTALDGPSCLRIAATAAELLSGRPAPVVPSPVRPLAAPERRAARTPVLARPARVAAGRPGPVPGNAMLVAELPVPRREPGASYTVNDQLMAATALTVADWNREHGAPERPLRITMPVDDRSRGPEMPIGNGTRLVEVGFTAAAVAAGADIGVLLRLTAERTRALKARPRPPLGRGASLLTAPVLPVGARAATTRGLTRLASPWTSTTLLSNIGRIPYPLDFGEAGRAGAVWFSAPARMPRGLTVTTASTGGRLHLVLRWSRALLGDDDGLRLLEVFARRLAATDAEAL
ncbi:condensation protein [Streptomyces sp. PKU-EA00015]|uniref:condensation protein n=1 Tax=Streptomyces sp. PKU-EA00015 TaxID=2748326 RepID=UPI0015A2694E|nr:condensation protein [Streptomyces sp. PKU-EA00015]NWF25646.1 condensation protein [Streptomyces sp. PKU-EA00015]